MLLCRFGPMLRLFCLMLGLAGIAGTGCVSRKKLSYLQNLPKGEAVFTPPKISYLLQAGDVLKVAYSGIDPIALAPFGSDAMSTANVGLSNQQSFLTGYSVSDSGIVSLPILGNIAAGNRTVPDVETEIQARLNKLVRNATAKVHLVTFKITILGEVRTPGNFYVYNDLLTLPEALGFASDMTDNADRTRLRLIRRRQGVITITTIDMTDPAILASPNFYLQPNDVLYAVPIAQKADRLNLPIVAIGLSSVTEVFVLINLLIRSGLFAPVF
jgi:polysaccharide biosynthesis/export protein